MSTSPSSQYAKLVQVVTELCNGRSTCEPALVNDSLRQRDPGFFTRSGQLRFKNLILKAQEEGAPVEWIDNGVPAIKLKHEAARRKTNASHPSLTSTHGSLVRVLLKHCDTAGLTSATFAAAELRQHDAAYHKTHAASGFKKLILRAQQEGVPVVWVSETKTPAAVRLTFNTATLASLRTEALAASARTAERAARRERAAQRVSSAPTVQAKSAQPESDAAILSRYAETFEELNSQLQAFLRSPSHMVLLLPPMDQRMRDHVYDLASAYSIMFKSLGSGKLRSPTLTKVAWSGKRVKEDRVRQVLAAAAGLSIAGPVAASNSSTATARKSKPAVPRNKEGAQVGFEAPKIAEDNVGYKLLAAMGYEEGAGIGINPGISEPVGATIKLTKKGLGCGAEVKKAKKKSTLSGVAAFTAWCPATLAEDKKQ